jgi:hypothetical protein
MFKNLTLRVHVRSKVGNCQVPQYKHIHILEWQATRARETVAASFTALFVYSQHS